MRKFAIGMALASTAIATPALAKDGQWYAGLEGGAMLTEDQDLAVDGAEDAIVLDYKEGYDFDAIIGYDFGMFRLEAEGGYREGYLSEGTGISTGIPAGPDLYTGRWDLNGSSSALSFMVNAMLDFGDDDGVQGFVGGGAGVARVEVDPVFGDNFINDSDTGFAWQAIAGVRAPISKSWDAGLKYRYFNVPEIDLVDNFGAGRDIETKWSSHSILGSLIYNFGGEEELYECETGEMVTDLALCPAVVMPDPDPIVCAQGYVLQNGVCTEVVKPDPVVNKCTKKDFVVYFDWDVDQLSLEAEQRLDEAYQMYMNCGQVSVMLAGHTDRSGTVEYNYDLSERRNDSVEAYLIAKGIPGSVMSATPYGESRPAVPTPDGVREADNRRVEIKYGPGM